MRPRSRNHDVLVAALTADGWVITADPLAFAVGVQRHYCALAAERGGRRIAIELPHFAPETDLDDLQLSVGAFAVFEVVLQHTEPHRELFHAITDTTFAGIFSEALGELAVASVPMRLIVFRESDGRILRWVEADGTAVTHVRA